MPHFPNFPSLRCILQIPRFCFAPDGAAPHFHLWTRVQAASHVMNPATCETCWQGWYFRHYHILDFILEASQAFLQQSEQLHWKLQVGHWCRQKVTRNLHQRSHELFLFHVDGEILRNSSLNPAIWKSHARAHSITLTNVAGPLADSISINVNHMSQASSLTRNSLPESVFNSENEE